VKPAHAALDRLALLWRGHVDRHLRRLSLLGLLVAILALSHLARVGTVAARAATALTLAILAVGLIIRSIRRARSWRRPEAVARRAIGATDADLAARTVRALRLADRAAHSASFGSAQLATAHLDRLIDRIRPQAVDSRARRIATRLQYGSLALALLAAVLLLVVPFRVIEGLDVLFARRGIAPLALDWLEQAVLVSHPPAYLHQPDVTVETEGDVELPKGSVLTLRGTPKRAGRRLLLWDGAREVPFVGDASGGVVAHWTVGDTMDLNVAARFGRVLVQDPLHVRIEAVADEAPVVVLDGAPRTVRLLDAPIVDVQYDATDDHGLREVALVLRSGTREERRVLVKLDGETRHDRGGYRLRATDPFFRRALGPVEVVVQALDNDAVTGPKWGESATLTIIVPHVGESEAERFAAVTRFRDAAVDAAAFRIEADPAQLGTAASRREHVRLEREATDRLHQRLDEMLAGSYGGIRLSGDARMLALGQMRKLDEAFAREARAATAASHVKHRKATEDLAILVDAALGRLDVRDSAATARRLSEVADDAALGAQEVRTAENTARGRSRLQSAIGILDGGGAELRRLGALGRDLGEIVAADLKRIRRAHSADDYLHAELAARDLAARLRKPGPSFGAARRGGVEAGGTGTTGSAGSDDARRIAREVQELEELVHDHAAEIASVERALADASTSSDIDDLRTEAREHARAVREAVRLLPHSGAEPGTAEAAAADGRVQALAMADDLERGDPAGATSSGRRAIDHLRRAQREPLGRDPLYDDDVRGDARRAAEKLDPELGWAQRALERLRERVSQRAADELRGISPRENAVADRGHDFARRGKQDTGSLPGQTIDRLEEAVAAMREAARSLGEGRGERALERQRAAQRLLEMARPEEADERDADGQDGSSPDDRNGDVRATSAGPVPIPGAADHKGPEAFRKRVLEGLGTGSDPRLREAVKRYAEGLLR
jgi:hypothetical protein